MRLLRWLCGVLLLAITAHMPVAWAHEARPAYLEIKETAPGQFSILWRTPLLSGMRLPVMLKLPDNARNIKEPTLQELADSLVERRWIDAGPGDCRASASNSWVCKGQSPTFWCVSRCWTGENRPPLPVHRNRGLSSPLRRLVGVAGTYIVQVSGTSCLAPTTCSSCWDYC